MPIQILLYRRKHWSSDSGFVVNSSSGDDGTCKPSSLTLAGKIYLIVVLTENCSVTDLHGEDEMASRIRPTSVDLNFNNDGFIEAVERYADNADGHFAQYAYSCIGDQASRGEVVYGTFNYCGSDKHTTGYQFSESGTFLSLELINQAAPNSFLPSYRFFHTDLKHETGQVTRSTEELYDANIALQIRTFFDLNDDREECMLEVFDSTVDSDDNVESSCLNTGPYEGENNTSSGSQWDYNDDDIVVISSVYQMESAACIPTRNGVFIRTCAP